MKYGTFCIMDQQLIYYSKFNTIVVDKMKIFGFEIAKSYNN